MPRDIASASASILRRYARVASALLVFALAWSAQRPEVAQAQGIIGFDSGAPPANEFLIHASPDKIQEIATRHGLTILRPLDVPPYDVFLVRANNVSTSGGTTSANDVTPEEKITQIGSDPAVGHVELNGAVTAPEVQDGLRLDQSPVWILDALTTNPNLVDFAGAQVWDSYLTQPATGAIRLPNTRNIATGAGVIVAVIDTGVDPGHPILQPVLVPGYDFIDDVAGGSEWNGVDATVLILNQSPVWILDGMTPVKLNQSTLAILDQPRATQLAGVTLPSAFGHGTMVAGVIHLVAPNARIMPLKAFSATGTSRVFDIVRAIYYAVEHGARVINMSFSTAAWSPEITHAINVATDRGVICVASAGNLGKELMVYPAAHRNVLAIGSTNAAVPPVRSTFSNFGDSLVSLGAPGEGIITTYPGGGYAGAWGTSFSAPMVAGAAALLAQINPNVNYAEAAALLSKGDAMALSGLGNGRLNLDSSLRRVTDATKPTVTFVTPASGAVLQTISVSATATDNIAVAGVTFLVDGQAIGGEITSAPYRVSWNTTTVANGSHTLTAVARDTAGNSATATLSVTVSNDVTAPTVAVTGPAEGSVVDAVTVSVAAADDTGVVGVQLTLDGVALGAEDTEAPYEVTWNSANLSNGTHVLTATARDAAGHSTTSAPVTVVVANDFAAPQVSLATLGESVNGEITLAATATDDVGVAGVQFALDGVALGVEDTTAPFTVTWDSSGATNGSHVLTATARDASGRSTTSSEVAFTIANDLTAPTVSLTTASGSVSGSVTLAATASDDVAVTAVEFLINGVALATDTTAPYEVTWDTAAATNGAHIVTAVARDASGRATTAEPISVAVLNDNTPPTIALLTESATVSGSVTISASATDDVGVVGVQFFVNGEPLGAEDTAPGYDVTWDTTTASNGTHVVTAIARDASGRTAASEPLTVTISNN